MWYDPNKQSCCFFIIERMHNYYCLHIYTHLYIPTYISIRFTVKQLNGRRILCCFFSFFFFSFSFFFVYILSLTEYQSLHCRYWILVLYSFIYLSYNYNTIVFVFRKKLAASGYWLTNNNYKCRLYIKWKINKVKLKSMCFVWIKTVASTLIAIWWNAQIRKIVTVRSCNLIKSKEKKRIIPPL